MADSHADMPADSNAGCGHGNGKPYRLCLKTCTPEGVPPKRLMRIMQRFLLICNAETQVPTKQLLQNYHTCAG